MVVVVVVVAVRLDVYSVGEIPYTSKFDHIKAESNIILIKTYLSVMQTKHVERSKHM